MVSAAQCQAGILNRGSGGQGQRKHWDRLTRDVHACIAMFLARAIKALVQGI